MAANAHLSLTSPQIRPSPLAKISLYDLGPDLRQDDGVWGRGRKLIPALSTARKIVSGFRDGRHELSPLCPGACGARPRLVGDSIRLRRGHLRGHRQKARPARACRFRDGPARDPGKSPRAGCLGHHHQSFKSGHDVRRASRTPLIAPGRKPVEDFVLSEDHRVPLSPDLFRGPVAFQEEAQPGPGTGAGGSGGRMGKKGIWDCAHGDAGQMRDVSLPVRRTPPACPFTPLALFPYSCTLFFKVLGGCHVE